MSATTADSPSWRVLDVTPDDDNDLTFGACRSLFVTSAGDVSLVDISGTTTVWTVPAAFIIPVQVKRVLEASTATGIKALY
jgi:hypothetical protein